MIDLYKKEYVNLVLIDDLVSVTSYAAIGLMYISIN